MASSKRPKWAHWAVYRLLTSISPSCLSISFSIHYGGIFFYILVATDTPVPTRLWFIHNLYPAFVLSTVTHMTWTDNPVSIIVIVSVFRNKMSVCYNVSNAQINNILMHLQMQRDVWLDNVINLRQYILRYTVGNSTSLRNVAFHWLTSEYMQLAAPGRICATKYIFTALLRGKC